MPSFDKNLLYIGPVKYSMSPEFTEYVAWKAPEIIEEYSSEIGTRRLANVMTNGEIVSEIGFHNFFDSEDILKIILTITQASLERGSDEQFIKTDVCYLIFVQDNKCKKTFIITMKRDAKNVWHLGYEDDAFLAWDEGVCVLTIN